MSKVILPSLNETDATCPSCDQCLGRREFFRLGLGATMAATVAAVLPSSVAAAPSVSGTLQGGGDSIVRYPIPPSDGVSVDRKNEVILVRKQGLVMAFALSCPHQRSMLRWRDKDGIFRCTKHHSEYSPMGKYEKGRATRNMDRLAIHLDAGEVVVDRGTAYHSDEDPKGWDGASVSVS